MNPARMTGRRTGTGARPAWPVAARITFVGHLRIALWFWAALVAVLICGHILMEWIIPGRALIARYGAQPLIWFAFSVTIIFVYSYLPLHVASGMTRRAFIRANLATAVLIGVLHGAMLALMVSVERAIFANIADPAAGQGPFVHWDSSWGIGVAQMLVMLAAVLSGLLVAIAYYRTTPLRGTILLLLTVTPLLAVLALMAADAQIQAWLGLPQDLLTAALLSLPLVGAMALAFHLATRRVPIRTVEEQ